MKVSDAILEIKQINETLTQISKHVVSEDDTITITTQLSNQVARYAARYRGILEDKLAETNIEV